MTARHSRHIFLTALTLSLVISVGGCASAGRDNTPTPDPLIASDFNPVVNVTGEVLPVRWAALSPKMAGTIDQVHVELGDQVEQGDLLVTLSGQAALRAAVTAAEQELMQARHALEELEEGADLARSQMELELAQARDALEDAEYMHRVRQEGNRASAETIDAAEARLVLAENEVDRAKAEYDKYSGRDSDDPARALALRRLANARQDRDAALRALNWYTGSPTEIEQDLLDAEVAIAQARVAEAERTLARMQEGPDIRALETAQARLENAEAQLASAKEALADSELRAPFSGTVGELYVRAHEYAAPGVVALELGDLGTYRIYTTDLNEIDAARVRIGDRATVAYDAAPDFVGSATVVEIAAKPSLGGSINYTAILEVEEIPEVVTWGMTAFVDIEVQE